MTNEQLELLKKLYLAHSPSRNEEEVAKIVKNELTIMKIPFEVDDKLQIYRFVRGQPIFAAHMDQVGRVRIKELYIHRGCIFGDGNLGADDKNGVWILLQLLNKFPNISFIFSTCEECGFEIDSLLKKKEDELKETPYGLVFDRRHGGDIIGWTNDYCNKDFEDDVHELGKEFGYSPTRGSISDCDQLSRFGVPCVNLSCGYYNPHSEDEFTALVELENALNFADKILSTLTKKYSRVETKWRSRYTYTPSSSYRSGAYDYSDYGFGYYGWREDTWAESNKHSFASQRDNMAEKFIEYANWGFPPKGYYSKAITPEKKDPYDDYPCIKCDRTKKTNCADCKKLDEWYEKKDDKKEEYVDTCPKCGMSLKDVIILDEDMFMCDACGHMFESETKEKPEEKTVHVWKRCPTCKATTKHVEGMCVCCYDDNEIAMPF